jgi:trehalose 6-phosphate synthase
MTVDRAAEPATARALDEVTAELLARRRLIMASNRGPVELNHGADGALVATRGGGGLVTALSGVSRFADVTWVAAAITEGDREAAAAGRWRSPSEQERMYVRFVAQPADVYRRYYNVFCNPLLWFIQHYMWNTPRTPNITRLEYEAWERGYVPVNQAFGVAIAEEAAGDGDPPYVIAHDYHLYNTPGEVRARLPGAIIQHFTHIPWPDPRYWEILPAFMRESMYAGLCAADIIGLQTNRDVRNFLLCAEAFVAGAEVDFRRTTVWHDGRLTQVRAYPISVDAPGLEAFAAGPEVALHEERLAHHFQRCTIVRVFRAFESLLQRSPHWRGEVAMLAFIVPSRSDLGVYQTYTDEVFELIEAINAEHGTPTWQPITAFYENNYAQAIAAMKHADVLLVNPLIDGMNLVAKEGALVNGCDAPIVLSEAAGAYEQMREHVIGVAPADIEGTVRALEAALAMPAAERRRNAAALKAGVRDEDLAWWLERQFRDLLTLA